MNLPSLLFILLVHSLPSAVWSLRCQCSTQDGAVTCYNGWCEVHNYQDKLAACAVVQHGARQHYACVRVKKDSEDSCKVDKKNGETLVRCWCRHGDYCNVDLADRVEDGDLQIQNGAVLTAEELPTSTMLTAVKGDLDDFQIEQNYDTDDISVGVADWDSDEDDDPLGPPTNKNKNREAPLDSFAPPRLPSSPHQRGSNRRENEPNQEQNGREESDRRRPQPVAPAASGPTLPPWRREYPVADARIRPAAPPPPADHFRKLPPPPFVRPAPPFIPPTTTSSTSTSTTTTTTTTTTTRAPTTTTVRTTTTTEPSTTTTRRIWYPPVKTTPDPAIEAARRAAAARSYKLQKQKYRPFDLNEKKEEKTTVRTSQKTTKQPENDDSDVPDEMFLSYPDKKEEEIPTTEAPTTTTIAPTTTKKTSTTTRKTSTTSIKTIVATVFSSTVEAETKKAEFGAIAGMVGGGNGPPPKMNRHQIPKSKQDFYQEIVRSATNNYNSVNFIILLFLLVWF